MQTELKLEVDELLALPAPLFFEDEEHQTGQMFHRLKQTPLVRVAQHFICTEGEEPRGVMGGLIRVMQLHVETARCVDQERIIAREVVFLPPSIFRLEEELHDRRRERLPFLDTRIALEV
ncbi:MAG: hypothetical protein RL150_116 [Candidatus Parcubacteria bacterium]